MRYILETKNHQELREFIDNNEDVELITQYEPIEKLTASVEKMRQLFNEFKANPGSWEIMIYYLRGRGIAKHDIAKVLNGLEEFFDELNTN